MRKGKWDNIEESLKEKLKELQIRCEKIRESDDNTPCFTGVEYCNHQILEKLLENTSFKAKYDDFHAKLYAGIIINKKSEVLFTSFNLLTSELKQKENFVLIEMDSNELSSQIRAFFKDSKKIKETSFPF